MFHSIMFCNSQEELNWNLSFFYSFKSLPLFRTCFERTWCSLFLMTSRLRRISLPGLTSSLLKKHLVIAPTVFLRVWILLLNLDNSINSIKGIVLRDFHICFWYHSIDLKFLHLMEPFVYFLNFVFGSNFSIFASQRSELTLFQSGAQRQDFFYWFYIGK
jgi:hypothetical protein